MLQPQSFGTWLRLKRKSLDLTREALADRVGCSAATIRKLEAEERRPSAQIAERLADIFEIPSHERSSFLRFARGDQAAFNIDHVEASPWQAPGIATRLNLPATVTSLVGRQKEIADLHAYLLKPDTRLITLVGPPGIGKTRLSIEIARKIIHDFPDGVFFVPLAPLDDASLIAHTVIQSLGYVEKRNQPNIEMLKAGIGDKHLLLILDNCEHLIEDIAPFASNLLLACPHLKVITTSRESLRIPGEWLYPVPTLNLPKENSSVDEQTALQFPALVLFAERACTVRPDFTLNANNLHTVITICAQLDGLPLAIELLASRMRLMSPQTLLERMSNQFILSADGLRAVSARQKTLKNAIGWSYDFLLPEEQELFAYLSVFSGGFTLAAAESIFSGMFADNIVTEIITSLSDKSLLLRTIDTQGEIRFSMLFTIQQFALEHLRQTGHENQIRDAHLSYFVQYAETGERKIRGPHQAEWIERLESEHNNNRVALEWAVSTQNTESALRLFSALGWTWEVRGRYNEARDWLEKIRALPNLHQYPLLVVQTLNHIGRYFLWAQDNFLTGLQMLEESQEISTRLGEAGEFFLAETLNWLGLLTLFNEENGAEKAGAMFARGLELYEKWNDSWGIALSLFHLGILESNLQHQDRAITILEQSYNRFLALGDVFFMGRVALFLGHLYLDREYQELARKYFEEHLRLDTELKFWNGIAEALRDLGKWHHQQGNTKTAEEYYEQCRAICHEHGLASLI